MKCQGMRNGLEVFPKENKFLLSIIDSDSVFSTN